MTISITELNHAVLYVRDVQVAVAFYRDVLGFVVVTEDPAGRAAFLRAGESANHHDLGLFSVGADAPEAVRGAPGLYHLAWRVGRIEDLVLADRVLREHGALVGRSDHGVSKSLYAVDPDGHEFEIMFMVPPDQWGDDADQAVVRPLDLDAEVARFSP